MKKFILSVLEIVEMALVAVVSVVLIRNFLIQPFLVSGQSMVPNFYHGDYLLIDELTYRFRSPARGEVAVFRSPSNEATYFIKRVIGLPGERVEVKNGQVLITNASHPNGFIVREEYLPAGLTTSGSSDYTLGDGEYFVLGDNRSYSYDSRSWGPLKKSEMVGLVRLRLWPLSGFRAFAAPQY